MCIALREISFLFWFLYFIYCICGMAVCTFGDFIPVGLSISNFVGNLL